MVLLLAGAPPGRSQSLDLDRMVTPPESLQAPEVTPTAAAQVAPPGVVAAEPPASAIQAASAPSAPAVAPPAQPLTLTHPDVIDSATLSAGGQTARLFGIAGAGGDSARGLKGAIASAGDSLICSLQASNDYVCLLPDGTDIAMMALVNGAAQARPDAPNEYRQQESAAQAARRGIWANLPPPPVPVTHPVVRDTATLEAARVTYALGGVEGVAGRHAIELQAFIAANGDTLTCQQQGASAYYTCLMPDGTDLAKILLVNGAARAGIDAPDEYRLQQHAAIGNRRGIWQAMAPAQIARYEAPPWSRPEDALAHGAEPEPEGIAYIGGQPTAVVDGEVAFLVFGGALGWGYYDHFHHWRGAPDRFAHHLERFHPEGRGLRGYAPGGMREAHLRADEFRPGAMRNVEAGRFGYLNPADARVEIAARPEIGRASVPGYAAAGRPGFAPQEPNRFAAPQVRPNPVQNTGPARPMLAAPAAARSAGVVASGPRSAPAASPARHKS